LKHQVRDWEEKKTALDQRQCFHDATIEGRRFVSAYNGEIAQQTRNTRKSRLARATSYIKWHIARTVARLSGSAPATGKVLTHEEILLHLHDYLRDGNLTKFYKVFLDKEGHVDWHPENESRAWEREIDGKLLLETTNKTLSPPKIVVQYKELQDIERCFRTLKSSLGIRPMYHCMDRRVEAHIFMRVMALQLHRFMRNRLHATKIVKSPERVLEKLSSQRTVDAEVKGQRIRGLTAPTPEQLSCYRRSGAPKTAVSGHERRVVTTRKIMLANSHGFFF
jgi:hypothetical protein